MILHFLLVIWSLPPMLVHSIELGQRINTTSILTEYTLVCGFDYLCDPSSVTLPDKQRAPTPMGYSHIITCPHCSCNMTSCFVEKNCCPDIVFRYPDMSCVSLALSNDTHGDAALMVTTCPPDTPPDVNIACTIDEYNNANKITLVPVSSTTDNVVFRNDNCAKCHGQGNNFTNWNFNIECDRMVDINQLSSYEEIFQSGLDNMCQMNYLSPRTLGHFACSGEDIYLNLKPCNITGHWPVYDAAIDFACRNIQSRYRGFENIFCFVCNPSKPETSPLISACNKTGMWDTYDSELESACLQYPQSQIAYPFKNRFCYLCNRVNNMSVTFMDAETIIAWEKWEYVYDNSYEAVFGIKSFRHGEIPYVNIPKLIFNSSVILSDERFSANVNVSKLLFLHYLHFGFEERCPGNAAVDTYGPYQQCICNPMCVTISRCCPEFAMSGPVKYTNEFENSLSVSKCYRNKEFANFTLQDKCEVDRPSFGIFHIPVRSRNSGILYRNVYCFLCNEGQEASDDVGTEPEYDPLDLMIKCNFTFQTERYVSLQDMLTDFTRMEHDGKGEHCTVSTVYDLLDNSKLIPDTIHTCNVTGNWDVYDFDIEWACLHYFTEITRDFYLKKYKNIFCEMCNTALDTGVEFTSCNLKGFYVDNNSTISDDCERYPQVTSMKPYKNAFCMLCNALPPLPPPMFTEIAVTTDDNSWYNDLSCSPGTDIQFDGVITSTIRDLFSISASPELSSGVDNVFTSYGNHCVENEIYDIEKSSCILQECAGGKMLQGENCIPLLQLTSSLGYTLALRLTGSVLPSKNIAMENILYDLENIVYKYIAYELSTSPRIVSSYISTANRCRQHIQLGETINITFSFYTSFYLEAVVNRYDVESRLINLTNRTIIHKTDILDTDILVETHHSALDLPGEIILLDFEANCFRVTQKDLKYDRNAYRLKLVSKLLLCPRVRIEKDRYEIDSRSRRMTLLPNGPVLSFENYEFLANTSVLICVEDFKEMIEGRTSESEQDLLSSILGVLSFLCTCLSMVCLIITFLTYCFFAELRTIPGKNNMSLIFSLFFSQGLTQFGMIQTKHTIPCTIIAICIHFFWLSTFFSMNICSFHMFRVFVFPLKEVKRAHRWTCFCYVCYIFGMSALIVILYIALSVTVFEVDNLGYTGNGKCFLTSFESVIATFISPVILVCVFNIVFFVVVAYKISTAPKVPSNKNVRQEFPLYVKLFVLTGATWTFQIIDAFIPLSVFSIISGIINSLQGVFIFLSYSVNSRVRKFYKERLSSTRISRVSQKRTVAGRSNYDSFQSDEQSQSDSRL
ncbi:uncharacterized protein LOC110453698 [Mizuhopecten yessoensis]|uniref:uncharacterized protein LOC110453698 n=1 Tax=Mizuhopecten yessoensis TaxID=6573 RepID=UPI000B457A40|nr:uncharacterized protein LOC110453698 [Mizuhopecten yessoensis]